MISHNLLRKQVTSELKKRRLVLFTIIFISFLYLFVNIIFGETGLIRYLELRDKRFRLEQEIKDVEMKNARLKSDLQQMKENPFYLEKHAREDFGMAKPDEYIFRYDR